MLPKVLIVLTSHGAIDGSSRTTGYYLPEVSHVYYQLKDAGYEIDFVSPKGGNAPMDPSGIGGDPLNERFMEDGEVLEKVRNTRTPSEINPKDYSALYFAGGHGTMYDFPNNPLLAHLVREVLENNGILSAVCHGVAGFIGVKNKKGNFIVRDIHLTSFSNEEEVAVGLNHIMPFLLESALKKEGAQYSSSPKFTKRVIVEGNIVTGQNPASAYGVGEEIIKLLKNKKEKL